MDSRGARIPGLDMYAARWAHVTIYRTRLDVFCDMQALSSQQKVSEESESTERRRLLLVPFHFPPIQGSTGASRSFEFARWLPDYGWDVTVLSVSPRAYPKISDDMDHLLPVETTVVRAFALDASRHLAVAGRYFRWTEIPDRWSSWILSGVIKGLIQILSNRPDIIYSTYPIPSSHVIGLLLHKLTGIPWVAEFRDPMVEEGYPAAGVERDLKIRLEDAIFRSTSRLVAVTPSAAAYYEERSGREPGYVVEIPNGYSEFLTSVIERNASTVAEERPARMKILHSGVLYDNVRSPCELLLAIQDLARVGIVDSNDVEFVFRGSGNEVGYNDYAAELGIESLVQFLEPVSYTVAYEELARADALLLMQGKQCNRQIPAKLYEYCALRKPILSLADPEGDTGRLVESLGLGRSVALEDRDSMRGLIPEFLEGLRNGTAKVLSESTIARMSRRARAEDLARVLDRIVIESGSV